MLRTPVDRIIRTNQLVRLKGSAVRIGQHLIGRLAQVTGLQVSTPGVPHRAVSALMASGTTQALMLTCIDFRLVDVVAHYMNGRGMLGRYDQVILAGASLAPGSDKFPNWAQTYWDHLDVAIKLHRIQRVIVLDHRDCGAYRLAYGQDLGKDPDAEAAIHRDSLMTLRDRVLARHPDLEVELLLMGLDGNIETIGADDLN